MRNYNIAATTPSMDSAICTQPRVVGLLPPGLEWQAEQGVQRIRVPVAAQPMHDTGQRGVAP